MGMGFRTLHPNLQWRLACFFGAGTAQFTTTPYMTIYLVQHFGSVLTGLLLMASMAMAMVGGMVGGYLTDRLGRRRILIVVEAVMAASYGAMAIASVSPLKNPAVVLAGFLLVTTLWGVYGPADEAMLLDVTPEGLRPSVYGIFYWMANVTMGLGTVIGAVTFSRFRPELFGATSITFALVAAVTTLFIQESAPVSHMTQHALSIRAGWRSYGQVFTNRPFVRYLLAGLFMMAIELQLQTQIPVHLIHVVRDAQLTIGTWHISHLNGVEMLGILRTENTVMVVLLAGWASKWIASIPSAWLVLVAVLVNAGGYAVMMAGRLPTGLLIAMFVATLGEIASVPARQSLLGSLAPEDSRGIYIAVHSLNFNAGGILASLSVSLAVIVNSQVMAGLTFGLGVTAALLYWAVLSHATQFSSASSGPSVRPPS